MTQDHERGDTCRFVVDGASGAYANLALEEAMFRENKGLTVRVWTNERSVILGRAQLARFETDLDYCQVRGVPVVRRITAGGAVYHGPGNVNWSLFVGREFQGGDLRYVWGVGEIFKMAAGLVTEVSAKCGVETWLDEPNRILSEAGKVSGMAAYVSRDGLLCHGTYLLSADLEEARRLTEPTMVSLERKYTRSRSMKMANTGIELGAFITTFRDVVGGKVGREVDVVGPTGDELRAMDGLVGKYRSPIWNLGDPFGEGM